MNDRTITHCIFDMDGLLLDTESIYTELAQAIIGRYGKILAPELKVRMIGRGSRESAALLIDTLELPITPEAFLSERKTIIADYMRRCKPMPGAVDLVRSLRQLGVPTAIATSSEKDLFEAKTEHHQDWFSEFQAVITGDYPGLKRAKPAPDIFLLAADALKANPATCLVFEDSPAGIEAARSAGMRTVFVPDRDLRHLVSNHEADQMLHSLVDFPLQHWHFQTHPGRHR